jgi:class 3 adenylate cyclase
VADLVTVLDAAGSERPVIAGEREGGSVGALLAATHPERARALVWYAPSARSSWAADYPWGAEPGSEYVERDERALGVWGTNAYGEAFLDAEAAGDHDISDAAGRMIGLMSRHLTTPDVAREVNRIWYESDIRELLPSVRVPTLIIAFDAPAGSRDEAAFVASLMPEARLGIVPGEEVRGDSDDLLEMIADFVGVDRQVGLDTRLVTVLFTDIVDSTERQAAMGDRRWKQVLERHHDLVRALLARWRGDENDTAGDGFFVTFDGPARAVRCALEIIERVRELHLEVRAGVHTGECEVVDGKAAGIAVTTGARIASLGDGSGVMVSQTVKDLVVGSGFTFEDAGDHELKGVPDRWHLYRVVDG